MPPAAALPWRVSRLPLPRAMLCLWLLLAGLLAAARAHAGIADAPGGDLEVSLITYGPGTIYWERFGHDALELRDRVSGQAVTFNYGVFDFEQKNFLLNFARGRMNYMMDAEYAADDMAAYRQAGRWIEQQKLALSPDQAGQLRDFLLWNLQPAHRHYRYDYYADNCTTRVRDALDRVLGGQLKRALQARRGRETYRQQTDRLMAGQPWLMLLLDLGLGPYADQPLDAWRASFIPMTLMRNIATVRIGDTGGRTRPLLAQASRIARARHPDPPAQPPALALPLLLAGLVWGLLLVVCGRYRGTYALARWSFAVLGSVYLLAAGLAGLFMLALWTVTAHVAGWSNVNLLLFTPFSLLLVASLWRRRPGAFGRRLAAALGALALLAVIVRLLPGFQQQNLPWILFSVPIWLGLCQALWRPPARPTAC